MEYGSITTRFRQTGEMGPSTDTDETGPLVELRGATVRFGAGADPALLDIDLRVERGTSLALVGANGSGKSTLLDVLSGLLSPTGGKAQKATDLRVAYVRQHGPQGDWVPLTALEVVRMGRYRGGRRFGRLGPDDRTAIERASERMEVADVLDRSFDELSGGQRQRVMIAQALCQEPNLLLLDEPITGLDLPSQQLILDLIDHEPLAGTTVIVSTHHLDEARHCREVALLAGCIVALGPPEQVLQPDRLRQAFGPRVLGQHEDHEHDSELFVLDHHGHDHDR